MFSDTKHFKLSSCKPSAEILDILTPEQAIKYKAIPISADDFEITFVVEDPNDLGKTDLIALLFPEKICNFKHSSRQEINEFIDEHYRANELEKFLEEYGQSDIHDKYKKI